MLCSLRAKDTWQDVNQIGPADNHPQQTILILPTKGRFYSVILVDTGSLRNRKRRPV